jgi:aspartyl-tRNA(Asn)/glutamyl-tRNA(Gln) amidotransferase subunit A
MGFDPKDSTSLETKLNVHDEKVNLTKLRIGIPEEYNIEGMSSEVKDLWTLASHKLAAAGVDIVPISLPHTKYSLSAYSVLKACDVASNFSCFDGVEYGHRNGDLINEKSTEQMYSVTRTEGFNDTVKGFIFAGNYFLQKANFDHYFMQAAKVRRLICRDFDHAFEKVDLLLTPVTLGDAPTLSRWIHEDNKERLANEDFCTLPANFAGLPALSVPCQMSSNRLPLGLQLIGRHLDDYLVLSVAKELDKLMKFPKFGLIVE